MASKRKGFQITPGLAGSYAYAGYVKGIEESVKTDLFLGTAVNVIHARLADSFNLAIDAEAKTNKGQLHHVYEAPSTFRGGDTIGDPLSRLWVHTLVGRGRNKIAGFTFLPSTVPMPVNPILTTPPYHVNEGVHVFTWKAPVFEYAMPVVVRPQLTDQLAYVRDGQFFATTKPSRFIAGKGKSEKQFTSRFLMWWASGGAVEFKRQGLDDLMSKQVASVDGIKRATTQAAKKNFTLWRSSNARKEFEKARKQAKIDMERKRGRFIDDAAKRRMLLYGY